MKRVFSLLLAVTALVVLFSSCEPSKKVFSVGKLDITLTSSFEKLDGLGVFDAVIYSEKDGLTLYVVKEYPEDMAARGIKSFEHYVDAAREDFGIPKENVVFEEGLAYFAFFDEAENKSAADTVCMYEGGGTYYMIIFDCDALAHLSLYDTIIKYARSVKIN